MSFGVKPLGDRVVVKRLEAEQKTASGIVLPGQSQEEQQVAEVIAVGPGTSEVKMEIKVGDKIIFSPYGGVDFKYEGTEYKILRQEDIPAVVK